MVAWEEWDLHSRVDMPHMQGLYRWYLSPQGGRELEWYTTYESSTKALSGDCAQIVFLLGVAFTDEDWISLLSALGARLNGTTQKQNSL